LDDNIYKMDMPSTRAVSGNVEERRFSAALEK
jgi:hypothetical protein